ncbi:putative oxidoreductase OrdL [Zancudomyces culisetae]|uniref:Putative oxidoreductase OrdL n=1 Tax=Zancudomyces culisetae TaxID=1213189 RepID=A0A1R1PJJ8_ZANCU|nr:putative oxidoreductase OrdL [Zancudomyces culisetae]|eukprot:OMH81155.1 putative oxidoreductase OrdL [Zancudomyces culisetae]
MFTNDPGLPSKNPTQSVWLDENPLKNYKSSEKPPKFTDIVVIGSGFSGASISYHLLVDPRTKINKDARNPASHLTVTMLEAREPCGGATGRNGGHLIPSNHRDFIEDCKGGKVQEEFAVSNRLFEQIGALEVKKFIEDSEIDCEFRFRGNLQVYEDKKEFEEDLVSLKEARKWGIGGQQIYSHEDLVKEFGPNDFVGGIKIPGGQVFPAKLIWHMITKSIEQGLLLYSNTPVTKIDLASPAEVIGLALTNKPRPQGSQNVWKVTTENGDIIYTHNVVHATNAYVSHLLKEFRSHVFPVRAQVISPAPQYCTNLFDYGLSLRYGLEYAIQRDYPKGRLIFGGRRTSSKTLEVDTANDAELNPDLCRDLRNDLKTPQLGNIGNHPEIEYDLREWTGIMGFSDDVYPYVGQLLGQDGALVGGQYASVGFSGHGMPKCFRCGREVARLISESYIAPSDAVAIRNNSSSVKNTDYEYLRQMAEFSDQKATKKLDTSVWQPVGVHDIDTWDYPLPNAFKITPERMSSVNSANWANRTLIAIPDSKL